MKLKKLAVLGLMAIMSVSNSYAGVTKEEFDDVISSMRTLFAEKVVTAAQARLIIDGKWEDATVNSHTQKIGDKFIVNVLGGLARYKGINKDGLKTVVCVEIGHILGGAPKYSNGWASTAGQSDYYSTAKCLKKVFEKDNNIEIVKTLDIPNTVTVKCSEAYDSAEARALCIRSAVSGINVANFLADLNNITVSIDTPVTTAANSTNANHPVPQCRLDTYFAGALCDANLSDDHDLNFGYCEAGTVGGRPACWFKP
jgi:hypothetical protein